MKILSSNDCVANNRRRIWQKFVVAVSLGAMAASVQLAGAADTATPAPIRIALYRGPGTGGAGPTNLMARLDRGSESKITSVSAEDIRAGALTNYDVVIFAGGSGSKEAASIGDVGCDAVRNFVGSGGGYIGICAGAYLASSGYPWSLHLINAKTVSTNWQRGRATLKLELTSEGNRILGKRDGQFDVIYHNGPVVKPDSKTELPPYDALAFFRTEVAENNAPVGVMINSPAVFSAPYKRGRVVCISPHPEQTPGLEDLVPRAVKWVASREESLANKPRAKAE